jgi:hypothetical protein
VSHLGAAMGADAWHINVGSAETAAHKGYDRISGLKCN